MGNFGFYFALGWEHIISLDALDHQLFITVLAAIYLPGQWKKILILVTAFTLGHSLTLALSTLDIIRVSSAWVEFLIPLTIVLTAVSNLFHKQLNPSSLRMNYFLALFFGLIHGLGFANTIRFSLLSSQDIFIPLLGFNLGLEVGQIVFVSLILILAYLFVIKIKLPQRLWIVSLSLISLIISGYICIDRWPLA